MEGRKKKSGFENRKLAKEKQEKLKKVIAKTSKLDNFVIKKAETEKDINDETNNVPIKVATMPTNEETDEITNSTIVSLSLPSTSTFDTESEPSKCKSDIQITSDPATWKQCDEFTLQFLTNHGIDQNIPTDFSLTKKVYSEKVVRSLTENVFRRKLKNGEFIRRSYLIYSESKKSIFCAPCRLFGGSESTLCTSSGFSDWKNVGESLYQHENSFHHKQLEMVLKERLSNLSNKNASLEQLLNIEIQKEKNYWVEVLKRVVSIIKKLASRTLPLRGDTEIIGNINNGNFLMAVELVSEFDPFLAAHIEKYGNPGKGRTSYLSSTVYEEIVILMGEKVKSRIINEIKQAKYYSISVDSTPDISHCDQLAFIVRYVKNGIPEEHFLTFMENVGHKSEDMEKAIIGYLTANDIDLKNMRGQSYDNARNMSGAYSGLQARIKNHNELAFYVPCAAHSMNLIGTCAADCCQDATAFFNFLQELYNYFSASTARWSVLTLCLKGASIKKLCDTRWACRYDACKALYDNWESISKALIQISEDDKMQLQVRSQARNINNQMSHLECAFMMIFWKSILERFNAVSVKLQTVEIDLSTVVEQYKSLILFINSLSDLYNIYESKAKEISFVKEFEKKRGRKRKQFFDEVDESESEINIVRDFKTKTFDVIISCLSIELKKRIEAYEFIYQKFDFLHKLTKYSAEKIFENAKYLYDIYSNDLDECFMEECVHFSSYLKSNDIELYSILQLSKLIIEKKIETIYPNVYIILRIFLSTHLTNCSAERSFSLLKRLKTYLRATITEHRLNALAILSIETKFTMDIDYSDVINTFAERKARRKL